MDTLHYCSTVAAILNIYIKNIKNTQQKTAERIVQINAVYEYLLSADMKPILHESYFDKLRCVILTKIVEHRQDEYVLANWQICFRLLDTLDNLESFILYGVESLRRSERLKNQHIDRMNKLILAQDCLCLPCIETATNLQSYIKQVKEIQMLPPSFRKQMSGSAVATRAVAAARAAAAEIKKNEEMQLKTNPKPMIMMTEMNITASSPKGQNSTPPPLKKKQVEEKPKIRLLPNVPVLRRSTRLMKC
jgi:hypothetical protein